MGQVPRTGIKMRSFLLLLSIFTTAFFNLGDSRRIETYHELQEGVEEERGQEEARMPDIWDEEEERDGGEEEDLSQCQLCNPQATQRCMVPQFKAWCQENCEMCL